MMLVQIAPTVSHVGAIRGNLVSIPILFSLSFDSKIIGATENLPKWY